MTSTLFHFNYKCVIDISFDIDNLMVIDKGWWRKEVCLAFLGRYVIHALNTSYGVCVNKSNMLWVTHVQARYFLWYRFMKLCYLFWFVFLKTIDVVRSISNHATQTSILIYLSSIYSLYVFHDAYVLIICGGGFYICDSYFKPDFKIRSIKLI